MRGYLPMAVLPWPFILSYVNHICGRQRLGPFAPCQPSTSFYWPSHERCAPAALIRCYIWMVLLGSSGIRFHYTLTNRPSNNFKLAEHCPLALALALLVRNKEQRQRQRWNTINTLRKLFSGMKREDLKCKKKMCLQYLFWKYSRNLFWQVQKDTER